MKVKLEELKAKVKLGVGKLGYQDEDAHVIADVLIYAQLRGNNQGIPKIATGGVPKATDVKPFEIVKENKCAVLVSGGHSMVAASRSADLAADLAEKHGVGIVASNHTYTSSGAIGYFARKLSKRGYIGFVCVGNGDFAAVAPEGSSEPKLGTNPFAYAFPYEGGEVVFDTATAAIAYFGVIEAMLKGEPLPEGVAVNASGESTVDAAEVLGRGEGESVGGAIKTLAGHKGFGLSLLVQLLGGPFALAGTVGVNEDDGSGTFVIAIDPGLLAGKEEYMKRSRKFVDVIKSAKPIPGEQVQLPGERGDKRAAEIEQSGEIEIADGIWNELIKFIEL